MPRSVWGTGTAFYGRRDFRGDTSYVTTEFISLFGIAIVPIRSLRVRRAAADFVLNSGMPTLKSKRPVNTAFRGTVDFADADSRLRRCGTIGTRE